MVGTFYALHGLDAELYGYWAEVLDAKKIGRGAVAHHRTWAIPSGRGRAWCQPAQALQMCKFLCGDGPVLLSPYRITSAESVWSSIDPLSSQRLDFQHLPVFCWGSIQDAVAQIKRNTFAAILLQCDPGETLEMQAEEKNDFKDLQAGQSVDIDGKERLCSFFGGN